MKIVTTNGLHQATLSVPLAKARKAKVVIDGVLARERGNDLHVLAGAQATRKLAAVPKAKQDATLFRAISEAQATGNPGRLKGDVCRFLSKEHVEAATA